MVRNKEVIDVKFGDLEMEEAATLDDGWDADGVLLNEDDVVICRDGLYPEICFLEPVHDLINKSMEKSIIVRRLRHSIGYRALIERFAWIAIVVDLKKPLTSFMGIKGFTRCIEYEGLLTVCYACGYHDHAKKHCKKEGTNDQASQDSMTTGNEEVHEKNSI
ncbi:hypothetical protein Goari_002380 [Gossypium aridum]|uniref:CCHC-type domain-containing protein n=1 Tax=Gossypium aridum TaxID=34290 RepID=A0A7J8Y912_GOSAI|nr:hypothetical protein [Gossypium aridum]